MTIEIDGHVCGITTGATDKDVCVELRIEGSRSLQNIKINATHDEVAHYKVGMPVKIQIRPHIAEKRRLTNEPYSFY